jgi:uncharacterized protein (DUF2267 family)
MTMRTTEMLFSESLHKTEEWLDELTGIGGFLSPAQSYTVLHAVLQTLRDRLTVDEAAQLGAQLPLMIRGVYYEGWKPAALPGHQRTKAEFLGRVAGRLGNCNVGPEPACRAVFQLLEKHISAGEIEDVRHMLHERVRDLWPAPTAPGARPGTTV